MSARPAVPRLHVLTDEVLQSRFRHADLAAAAWAGGADAVQLRDKSGDAARRLAAARAVALVRRAFPGRCFVVNDDPELAVAVDADGVHLGPEDPAPRAARRLVGPRRLVGVSAGTPEEARQAEEDGADYLGVGPVYGSTSKGDAGAALGLEGFARVVHATRLPVIAIGSLTAERVAEVMSRDAHGVAVLSAVCLAGDPEAATREIARALSRALAERGLAAP